MRGATRFEGYPGSVTVFVEVPDVEAALAHAEALGGTRMQGPDEVPGGRTMGKFSDPEGRLIGLITPPAGGDLADRTRGTLRAWAVREDSAYVARREAGRR